MADSAKGLCLHSNKSGTAKFVFTGSVSWPKGREAGPFSIPPGEGERNMSMQENVKKYAPRYYPAPVCEMR